MDSGPCRRENLLPITIPGCPNVSIHQIRDGNTPTGWLVWPVAVELCEYLASTRTVFTNKRIIELGSGTGLVGIVCGILGCSKYLITDLPGALPLCGKNIQVNSANLIPGVVSLQPLSWGNDADIIAAGEGWDLIIGTDIVYHQEEFVLKALAETVIRLSGASSIFLLAYEDREGMIDDEAYFFSSIRRYYKSLEMVDLTGDGRYLYIFTQFTV